MSTHNEFLHSRKHLTKDAIVVKATWTKPWRALLPCQVNHKINAKCTDMSIENGGQKLLIVPAQFSNCGNKHRPVRILADLP
jgi:hypothetical protein